MDGYAGSILYVDLTKGTAQKKPLLREGEPEGRVWEHQPLLDQYYAQRGWDAQGVPTPAKLKELGLA